MGGAFLDLLESLYRLAASVVAFIGPFVPYLLWFAFCLWALNWKKLGPVLKEGAWIALGLIVLIVALVWSQVLPSKLPLFGIVALPNFWWQLLAVTLAALVGLFAGWVQNRYSWTPIEVSTEPPAHGHHGDHGHHGHDDHGHHGHHADHAHHAHH